MHPTNAYCTITSEGKGWVSSLLARCNGISNVPLLCETFCARFPRDRSQTNVYLLVISAVLTGPLAVKNTNVPMNITPRADHATQERGVHSQGGDG